MARFPSHIYATQVAEAGLQRDPDQEAALQSLDRLHSQLRTPVRRRWWWPFGRRRPAQALSLYLHGPVGRGKSLIMDLFAQSLEGGGRGERVHFHAFMLDMHQRIHALQHRGVRDDPIPILAQEIAKKTRVLCFDEFVVNNIADAMILGRIFQALWDQGLSIVSTSNFAPDDLYHDGLHRDRFLPFIALIKSKMQIISVAGQWDYRRLHQQLCDVFFTPLNSQTQIDFEDAYKRLAAGEPGKPLALQVGARQLTLPWAAGGVCMARFADLCGRPLGAGDYLALAKQFQVLALDTVPILTPDLRNETSRFKVLIDALYEAGTLLIMRSHSTLDHLYKGGESVEFSRTLSRLQEMRGQTYVARALQRLDPDE